MHKTFAYAKLDLAISISPRKKRDGYYPVRYIDCQLAISDVLIFEKRAKDIILACKHPQLRVKEDNFVWRAASLLKELTGVSHGAKITLKKNIPICAGFGGGSSDAAACVLGLSKLWGIKLSDNLVDKLSANLGKDFYYSLSGKLKEVVGDGKKYRSKEFGTAWPQFWVLVVIPFPQKPSTGWVYEHLKKDTLGKSSAKIRKLKGALFANDKMGILKNLTNDFENSVSFYFPVIGKIKAQLLNNGASASLMAGAGLAVVGFFDSRKKAEEAKMRLLKKYKKVIITKTIN